MQLTCKNISDICSNTFILDTDHADCEGMTMQILIQSETNMSPSADLWTDLPLLPQYKMHLPHLVQCRLIRPKPKWPVGQAYEAICE